MSKVVLITTKKPPDWESWNQLKSRKSNDKARITMTQTEAVAVL